jgi:pimeloyl-ACP methyl ester carboxylesterase
MPARIVTVPVSSAEVTELNALEVEPESDPAGSVLLFLHGMGEAGSSLNELPKVCIHQTAPFQALLGRLPRTLVIAPQAPPIPSVENWNWWEYINDLARFLTTRYGKRRIVATGFSRGGLGVLQLISAHPDLVQEWAAVDPQPARDRSEADFILQSPSMGQKGWLRYGVYRYRSEIWKNFSAQLFERLPEANGDTTDLSHVELAAKAYQGFALSADAGKKNLYDHLGLEFAIDHSTACTL